MSGKFKVLFIGLGSIGTKHLLNFIKLCNELQYKYEIHALRSSDKNLSSQIETHISKEFFSEDQLEIYDIVFIANPTAYHFSTLKRNIHRTTHIFIEKPVFDTMTEYNIEELPLKKDSIYYVAAPLRYNSTIKYIKDNYSTLPIYSVRCICSSYLPSWRPEADYRNVYSSKKEQGGGVSLDLIHELDYLTFLFGFPKQIVNYRGKFSHLEITSDDLSTYILNYDDKLIELHLDYFGRKDKREIELYLKDEIITADLLNNTLNSSNEGIIKEFSNDEDMYIKEMRYFLNAVIKCKKTDNEIHHAYKVLKLTNGEL